MRAPIVFALLILWPVLAIANVKWHEFDVSLCSKDTMSIGRVTVTIETRDVQDTSFAEDNLVITVRAPGRDESQRWFTSTYSIGAVALHGNILLLKYGVGRGTCARTEHVKVFLMGDALEELADVQTSYYVWTNSKNAEPQLIEHQVKIQRGRDQTTLTFSTRTRHRGIPSEKTLRFRNDG